VKERAARRRHRSGRHPAARKRREAPSIFFAAKIVALRATFWIPAFAGMTALRKKF
jgi:hypothetical protein